jgi:phosphonate dehydrogenase
VADSAHVGYANAHVVFTHWVHPEVTAYLARLCDPVLTSEDEGVWPARRVADLAAPADGLITCLADRVGEAFLACPRLQVISATLKGYDNFDAEACTRHGVWLTILPDLLTIPTAELVIGLTIGIMRHIGPADQHMRGGGFTAGVPCSTGRPCRARRSGSSEWARSARLSPPGCGPSRPGSPTTTSSLCRRTWPTICLLSASQWTG